MKVWGKVLLLFVLTALIEAAFVGAYHREATGPLKASIESHTATLESGIIPSAANIDIFNADWVRVAHFESSFGQIQMLVDLIMGLVVAFVLIFGGISAAIAHWAKRLTPNIHLYRGLYFLALGALYALINLPLAASGYAMQFLRGTSYASVDMVIFNVIQDLVIGSIFALLTFVPFYWIMDRYRKWWWAFGALFMSVFMLFTAYVSPVLIDPLYYELRPLEDVAVLEALDDIVTEAGIPPERIFVSNASATTFESNAVVTGLFSTKRIILDDTLLTFYEPREIRVIVAHEIGHYVLGHLWYDMLFETLLTFASFWLVAILMSVLIKRYGHRLHATKVNDVILYPLLSTILFILPLLYSPIMSSISRTFEHQADVYETRHAQDPQSSIDGFKKMAYQSFIDVDPPPLLQFWFGTHPSVLERIQYYESERDSRPR